MYYTQNAASYNGLLTPGGTVSDLSQQGSGLVYGSTSTSAKEVGVAVANGGGTVEMVSKAASSRCYALVDNKSSFGGGPTGATGTGTWYGYFAVTTTNTCAVANVAVPTNFSDTGFPS